ncbi:MAG: histidinol dehydrogenase, partial [Acetomicrobium sp.]
MFENLAKEREVMRFLKRPDDTKAEDLTREVQSKVNDILTQIKENGWEALSKISKSLDGITPFRIDPDDMAKAWDDLPSNLKEALKVAGKNIRAFHRAQRNIFKNFECDIAEGQIAGMRFVPVKSTA